MTILRIGLLLSILALSGCFFTVKEMTVDPDKGYNHSQTEVYDEIQAQR